MSESKETCSFDDCNNEAVVGGRCGRHRLIPRPRARYGYDQDRAPKPAFPGSLDSPRNHLVELLAVALGEADLAEEIVTALDAYIEEGPSVQPFQDFTPNYKTELEKARAERDAAIACAEQALGQMQQTLDALRHVEAEPEKTNGHAVSAVSGR